MAYHISRDGATVRLPDTKTPRPIKPTPPNTIVFVYGTLRPAVNRWDVSPKQVARATLYGHRMHDLGAFPAITPSTPESFVVGDLVEATPAELARMDRIEGVPHHYKSEPVNVHTADGEWVEAVAYVYANPERIGNRPIIVDWVEHALGKNMFEEVDHV